MERSFHDTLLAFEENEENLNSARQKLFSKCNNDLFLSGHYESYEESLERYFFGLSRLFENGMHEESIKESLSSKDSHLRRTVLQIIKDGFFSDNFMQTVACQLLKLAVEGNDNDRVLTGKIFSRKYGEKSNLIALLPECAFPIFVQLEADSDDAYYVYQNIGHIILDLNARNLFREYILLGEKHENSEVRELAAEFKIEMDEAMQPSCGSVPTD